MTQEQELNALQRGYYTREELEHVLPSRERVEEGRVAVIECIESIPCNPCAYACQDDGIKKDGLSTPAVVLEDRCGGCSRCITVCPGLAIFMQLIRDGKGYVTMPYEFNPEPTLGAKVDMMDRSGKIVGIGTIVRPTYRARDDSVPRWVVTVEMDDPDLTYEVRAIKIRQ